MLLDNESKQLLKKVFNIELKDNVNIILYRDSSEYSIMQEELISEISQINKHISYNVDKSYNINYLPQFKINNIIFHGLPDGDKFDIFINFILMSSNKLNQFLSQEIIKNIKNLNGKVITYITSECKQCGKLIKSVQKLSLNSNIQYDIINLTYFKNVENIKTVPYTVVNNNYTFIGNIPLNKIIEKII